MIIRTGRPLGPFSPETPGLPASPYGHTHTHTMSIIAFDAAKESLDESEQKTFTFSPSSP